MKEFLRAVGKSLRYSYGRKYILVLLTLFVSTWLVWYAKIGDSIYRDIMFVVIGGYVAANVAQKAVEKKASDRWLNRLN